MRHVVVIGGGVVGLTTAWALLQAGHEVSLVEQETAMAQGASRANGGQLSYRYVSPLADAGIAFTALRWLLEADSPLTFRPEARIVQWRWLASFLAHCNAQINQRTTQRLLALGAFSQQSFAQLYAQAPIEGVSLRTPGKLVMYRNAQALARTASRLRADPASVERVLDVPECLAREPALAHSPVAWAGGIFTEGEALADCHALCLQLAQRLQAHSHFKGFVHAQAQSLHVRQGQAQALNTSVGALGADGFVIAAGLGSRALAATAGLDLPLYPLKGYSLTADIGPGHHAPQVSVTDIEKKVLYAQIGCHLRVAAMVDLVGEDARIDPGRMASLHRLVQATFPQAAHYESATPWAGLRPATPSGAPILGATAVRGLWLNVGHGGLGFTMSFGSARIVADLVGGKASPISLDGLQLSSM